MATGKALNGKPYAGNPHVRFDEGEVAPAATPRRGSLLYNSIKCLTIATLLITSYGCASERLYVRVVDGDGNPVTNGIVRVGVSTSHLLFGGGNSRTSKSGYAEGRTDTDGNAVVKFNGQSSDFGWYVEADGYYRSDIRQEHFKGEDVIIPPGIWLCDSSRAREKG